MGTEDVKVTAMNMYKYKEGNVFANVGRVALIFEQTSARFLGFYITTKPSPHFFPAFRQLGKPKIRSTKILFFKSASSFVAELSNAFLK